MNDLDTNDLIAMRTKAEYSMTEREKLLKRIAELIPMTEPYGVIIDALIFLLREAKEPKNDS